jgi:zinc protease
LTAKGLLLGTARRGEKAINEELDFMGASLNSSAGRDYATLTLRVLKKDLEKGFDLFLEVLTNPPFPGGSDTGGSKPLPPSRLPEDQPDDVAEKAFQENLFSVVPTAIQSRVRKSLPR